MKFLSFLVESNHVSDRQEETTKSKHIAESGTKQKYEDNGHYSMFLQCCYTLLKIK